MLKIKSSIKFLVGFMLLSWCGAFVFAAGTPAKLDMDIDWPNEMYYLAPGSNVSSLLNASLIDRNASSSQFRDQIQRAADASEREQQDKFSDVQKIESLGVDYKQIVTNSFIKELTAKGVYDDASTNNLELDVVMYGYSHKGGFNINMVPMLKVKVKLMDANGKRLFKGTGSLSTFGTPVAKAEYYDLLESKELAESLFVAAAEMVAQKALKKYK